MIATNPQHNLIPYRRLSGFYFFYFASLGVILPYWSSYLFSLGFDAQSIGELIALVMVTKIVSPNIWGWIADHTGKRMAIVRFGSLCAIITFAGIFWVQSYWWIALVMLLYSFFWNASLPQFEATTLSHLGKRIKHYGSIRLWGSVGFMLTVWLLGLSIQYLDTSIVPYTLITIFLGIWLMSLFVPETAAGHMLLDHEPLLKVLKKPHVAGLLVSCLLMQASHGAYYVFYTPYMFEHGYTMSTIGLLWALAVAAEVVFFVYMNRFMEKNGLRILLLFSFVIAILRWCLLSLYVDYLFIVIVIQLCHAATFGVYHAAAIHLIHCYFPGKHQGKGQALYSSMSFGAGGALGSIISGMSWTSLGTTNTYLIASGLALLGFIIAYKYIIEVDPKDYC